MAGIVHDKLACGIEFGAIPLPGRHVVAFQVRVLAGASSEPECKLGLAKLVGDTLDKGTERRGGRELSDAFDALGASYNCVTGKEATTLGCTVLPEHFEASVALFAEMLRTPAFPEEACAVNIELTRQELSALEDDAQDFVSKLMGVPAFGPVLGRHPLGERETLDGISRDDFESHWREHFHAGRMVVTVAGAAEPGLAMDVFEKHFSGFGSALPCGRAAAPIEFTPGDIHHEKDLEQQQIGICWPGADATDDDFPVQLVMLGILSGGMSARLFTEIREKQGLAYWVNAWHETPRGSGRLFLGASTTPDRCDRTFSTLLREVDRLAEDITEDELERAKTGILAGKQTKGDTTRSQCVELSNDLFFFGRPVPDEEKEEKVNGVGAEDIRAYLARYPRDELCVLTLGPRPLGRRENCLVDGADNE